jgi:hypothetical protein
MNEQDAVRNAIAAFTKLHSGPEYSSGVRGVDRGELNLNEMKCVPQKDGVWICVIPHIHLPLVNLTYEFSYKVREDPSKAECSCKVISEILEPE